MTKPQTTAVAFAVLTACALGLGATPPPGEILWSHDTGG